MTAPHSISSGSAEALEYLSVFADSGYYGLSNVQVRAICAALRTPALPSGEVEAAAWRWRTLPKFSEDAADMEWSLTLTAPNFINPHHHEVEPLYAALATSPTPHVRDKADYKIGWWLSAALEDPAVCAEMKADINAWFEAHQPGLIMPAPPPQPQPPTPPYHRWADTIEAASLTISPKGSKELDALAAEMRAGGVAQARLVREALAPFIKALAGVPATVNDAAPFARVSNDAIPGTMNIITFGEIRKLLAVLSPQAQAGPSLQKTQGSPAQAGAAAQGSRPRDFLAWAVKMFGPVAKLRSERLMRFAEEAIELAHAEGMERSTINLITDRVYSLPAGNVGKEIGQAQACLETFAENIGLSSADEAEREWQRVQEIPQEEWTRRHSAKQALGIALPSTEGK